MVYALCVYIGYATSDQSAKIFIIVAYWKIYLLGQYREFGNCSIIKCKFQSLKPMDSFGIWQKKIEKFFFLLHNFIDLYELLLPC